MDTKTVTKNLTLELRNAIQSQDLMLTRLVLNRVRSECSEDDQHRGDLADAIRDAETQIRTFKTNESHREAMEALRTSLEIRDMKTLRMALRDVKTTQNEEEVELVRKATAALEVYNSRRRASNLASELQDAIRCSDLKLTQLVLKRVREECTTKEQNEGSLVVAIEDAENLMRTLKSNETTRAVMSMLRSALKSHDITMLGLALRRARKECMLKFSIRVKKKISLLTFHFIQVQVKNRRKDLSLTPFKKQRHKSEPTKQMRETELSSQHFEMLSRRKISS